MKNGIKGYVAGILTCIMLVGVVFASNPQVREIFFGVQVSVNGEVQTFDDDMQPFIMDGRTFLPVRGIADALGVDVDFDADANMVLLNSEIEIIVKTAADYLNSHNQSDLDYVIALTRAMGMELTITADGNVLIYTYTFIEQVDVFDDSLLDVMLRPTAENIVLPDMSDFGVRNPAVRYVYLNADGTLLAEIEFSL